MTMTAKQFELLAKLLQSKEPVKSGARLVLLHNLPNVEAARIAGSTPQSVHRSVKRFIEVKDEVCKVFGGG